MSFTSRKSLPAGWSPAPAPAPTSWQERCASCLRGPRQILRSIVLLTCTVVVVYQIAECMKKIRNPPITTYTHFDFNETIMYPAVTVCRDPPYKADVLQKYGLYGHPRYTSEWKYFPFDKVNLKDFWEEATYNDQDNFIAYGLNSTADNILIKNSLHFISGQCQTILPRVAVATARKETGYSLLLNHSILDIDTTTSTIPPGYHVYIHQVDEPFAEHPTNGIMEYLYVNVGEELDVKLGVQQLSMLAAGPKGCRPGHHYSAALCGQRCRWQELAQEVGCSGPWMEEQAPPCTNYSQMKRLIVHYISLTGMVEPPCTCPQRCSCSLYNAHVVDRNSLSTWNAHTGEWKYKTGQEKYHTQIYIYFNSKTVSVYEEKHSYDWSLFLADFGGSLGFLLGLSVLGVIGLLENIYETVVAPMVPWQKSSSSLDSTLPASVEGRPGGDGDGLSEGQGGSPQSQRTRDFMKDYQKFNVPYVEKNLYI